MGNTLKIYNEFGITPKVSFTAAGQDFFVPVLDTLDLQKKAMKAFEKSYNKTESELNSMIEYIRQELSSKIDLDAANKICVDTLHLFLALDTVFTRNKHDSINDKIDTFLAHRFLYKDGKAGMVLDYGDHVKINSGIHEALPTGYAGVMFNKSGRGTQGFDTRACVIDEDYSGLVHLSLAFTKDMDPDDGQIYAGDKIVQQLVLPIWQVSQFDELTESDYNELMKNSSRGSNGFGSQNEVK